MRITAANENEHLAVRGALADDRVSRDDCAGESGSVLIWRLLAERKAKDHHEIEALDRGAHKLVGISLFLLAVFIAFEAAKSLILEERSAPTFVAIGVTSLSIAVMLSLARAKRRAAIALGSRALEADAVQTTAGSWLSIVTLAGVCLNSTFGWWWADPAAALGMTIFLVREGREAWRGEVNDCCA